MEEVSISPEELKRKLDRGEIPFIFDLRNEEDFDSWRIEGREDVESLNIPQPDFVGEEEKFMDRFPRDRKILTVCAHGDSSKYTAELLQKEGFTAVSLEGGMDAWSELYETHMVNSSPDIHQIYRVARGCITYLVSSEGEAVVIDSMRHIEHVIKLAGSLGVRITHVLDTHLQADHISGGRDLAAETGAEYHMSPIDAKEAAYDYRRLQDGEVITVGKSSLRALHLPGHTPGSTSLLLDGRFLFTGDTIMKTSIGRPDLGGKVGEWSALLYDTLFKRLAALSDDIVVLPTHAASIREQDGDGIVRLTLGEARQKLDLFSIRDYGAFEARIRGTLPENPPQYQEIRRVNLGTMEADEKKKKELEIGKNLCGMASPG